MRAVTVEVRQVCRIEEIVIAAESLAGEFRIRGIEAGVEQRDRDTRAGVTQSVGLVGMNLGQRAGSKIFRRIEDCRRSSGVGIAGQRQKTHSHAKRRFQAPGPAHPISCPHRPASLPPTHCISGELQVAQGCPKKNQIFRTKCKAARDRGVRRITHFRIALYKKPAIHSS